jgi:hypothetical protein
MLPPEDAPIVARLSRWLDWWFTPAWRALLTWVNGGVTYVTYGRISFFGFLSLESFVALARARQIEMRMEAHYMGCTDLRVSTVGVAEHSHIYANLAEHLHAPNLKEILLRRTKFAPYEFNTTARCAGLHFARHRMDGNDAGTQSGD